MSEDGLDSFQLVPSSEDDVSDDDGIDEEVTEKEATISGKSTKKTKEKGNKAAENDVSPSTNWTYGTWLMTKTLKELEDTKGADVLYHKIMQKNMDIISNHMPSMKLCK